ncbi:crossover junction endodeoxyribonuclease RuvC [Crocinitomicaceae bacterium]|nr:crossover junction endodeoxyribonuclease RuvC [Crocinitomicaceae bacterium]
MIILGVDQSLTNTAYILMEQLPTGKYKILEYGVIQTKPDGSMAKIASTLKRVRTIRAKLRPLAARADHVWLESLSFSSTGNATRDLAMLFFAIQDDFKAQWVAPTTLKKLATGKGNTKGKQAMFDALPPAAQRVFGSIPKSKGRFDLADAFWACKHGFAIHNFNK